MISKILVAVDGSSNSDKALDYAIYLAKLCKATLGIIHVVQVSTITGADPQTVAKITELLEKAAVEILDKDEEKVNGAGLDVAKICESGSPANVIIKVANDGRYDLIVIGSRGLGGIKELLLGSISHGVSQRANCPVLIVH